ncbi:MAG: glutaconyl-CoA decarboxylase subunit alpha, partial [Proteobacteria bacterium]|nr:glutaconyl-CoA decarboxylase subunit alpha [Pseudomonadota bacterium]
MKTYFEHMDALGKELKAGRIKRALESQGQLEKAEATIDGEKKKVEEAGFSTEKINARGWMTVWQRIEYLVAPGRWTPLHT